MKTSLKIALLLGVVTFVSEAGLAADQKRPSDGPLQGVERTAERGADRLQREFDRNKDGRVTQDEMNRTLGWRFATTTHRGTKMTMDQFMELRANAFRQTNDATFRRLDWNGDGKLTLAEFAAPQHVRFVAMDRDGTGHIWCALRDGGSGRAGLSRFCTDNDANMDGQVTRAELDASLAKRFSLATGGAQTMTATQFAVSEQHRFATANARTFRRLDADRDGLLTIREFADAELTLFARLDKNKDRVLTPDELRARYARGSGRRSYD